MSFKLHNDGIGVIKNGNCYMGIDNTEYLAWLEEGNTPEPADHEPAVPIIVTMRQARLALLQQKLLSVVDAAMTTELDRIWWDYSTQVEENHPKVLQIASALGWSDSQKHDLFTLAKTL